MKFKDYFLAKEIQKGIDLLGFRRPTDIQYKSIPSILKGEDVLAVAQTGTGKTAAFAIPILHKLHLQKQKNKRVDGVKCLVMVPTHELALQITEVFQKIGKYTNVRILAILGGVDQAPQIEALQKRVDILVATPGRLFDLMSQQHLHLNRVETLILDEADQMLDLGFLEDIKALIPRLPRNRQTLFFSATINQHIKKLAYQIIHQHAIRIQISPKDPVARNVDHALAFIEMDDKRFFLERIIKEQPKSKILVFVRTKVRSERVAKAMKRVNIEALVIHGDKKQQDRNQVLKTFSYGNINVLIATDVTARGIDIPDVDLVINYDLPDKVENYVHRVGRTGRGNKKGRALSFCSQAENAILVQIENYLNKPIEKYQIEPETLSETRLRSEEPTEKLEKLLKEVEALETRKRKAQKRRKD